MPDSSKCGDKVGEKQAHKAQNLDDKAHKILNRWDICFCTQNGLSSKRAWGKREHSTYK